MFPLYQALKLVYIAVIVFIKSNNQFQKVKVILIEVKLKVQLFYEQF